VGSSLRPASILSNDVAFIPEWRKRSLIMCPCHYAMQNPAPTITKTHTWKNFSIARGTYSIIARNA
jgi:Rieske Fe-S protein